MHALVWKLVSGLEQAPHVQWFQLLTLVRKKNMAGQMHYISPQASLYLIERKGQIKSHFFRILSLVSLYTQVYAHFILIGNHCGMHARQNPFRAAACTVAGTRPTLLNSEIAQIADAQLDPHVSGVATRIVYSPFFMPSDLNDDLFSHSIVA